MPTAWLDLPLMVAVVLLSRLIAPRLPLAVPDTVVQVAGGLVLGPSGLGWLRIDDVVMLLSGLGMGYLLLTAGMELELRVRNRGQRLSALASQAGTVLLAVPLTLVLSAAAHIRDRAAVGAALLTTLIMPALTVIRANANLRDDLAEFTILAGTFGEVAAVIVIAVSSLRADVGLSVAVLALLLVTIGALEPLRGSRALRRRDGGARGAVLGSSELALTAIVVCAVLTPVLGDEALLPTLAAGIWCSSHHPRPASWNAVRARLDGIGLTLLAPMSFVAAGARVQIAATGVDGRAWVAIPALILAMGVCRTVPTLAFARRTPGSRAALASGLLLSTKLTLVVVAVQVGQQAGSLSSRGASTLVFAAMLSVCVFPTLADNLARLRPAAQRCPRRSADRATHRPPGSDPVPGGACSGVADIVFSDA